MDYEKVKCLIIGSGPAGYTAAIYASRANLNPILIEGIQPGGQLTITTEIENFPGYPDGTTGPQMMEDFKKQALRFGTDIRNDIVTQVSLEKYPFHIQTDGGKCYEAETVIIATGASARWLGLDSEEKFRGMGVSACATCDGFFYRNQVVGVVGGGDTACEEATYLSNICSKVYLIVRRDELRASKVMQKRVITNPKIEILWNNKPIEILGDDSGVNGVMLENTATGELKQIELTGLFLAIGHHPNSDVFQCQIETDPSGYIITKNGTSNTNIPGVFAAGDVQDSAYRQAITAAASGCRAALDAERFLSNKKQ
ncbi:MAG: thioredoxin-disulfide reductase [Bacteroidales bacterium]|nr:thioredoxin-disulfide reductase [Bacteroidales bacterium]MDD4828919.1 thioredoxin-disulfide reductase [Bacteroidales bacterium]